MRLTAERGELVPVSEQVAAQQQIGRRGGRTVPDPTTPEAIERAARAVWRAEFGREPTEPLREKGGALDPDGYCMQLARAVASGGALPMRFRDTPTLESDPTVRAARIALEATDA
jgi:hypothetical protein